MDNNKNNDGSCVSQEVIAKNINAWREAKRHRESVVADRSFQQNFGRIVLPRGLVLARG